MSAQENQGSSVKAAEHPRVLFKEPYPLEHKIDDLVIDHANRLPQEPEQTIEGHLIISRRACKLQLEGKSTRSMRE